MKKRYESLDAYLRANRRTQLDLARELGISIADMSKYVNGVSLPRAERAIQISEATGVPLENLIRARARRFQDGDRTIVFRAQVDRRQLPTRRTERERRAVKDRRGVA
jgi:transcriptional regulator with XRE-family HTH domain